jgi:hypothetical protein
MGMSIDKAIDIMERYEMYVFNSQKEGRNKAIDIMRRYQKIREIAFPLQFCSTDKLNHEAIMKICEVLEDDSN